MTFEENKCKYHASNLLTDGFMLSDNTAWTVVVRVLESDKISEKKEEKEEEKRTFEKGYDNVCQRGR